MIQSGIWWLFLALAPVVYWLLPAKLRMPALGLASIVLLAVYMGAELLLMLAVAAVVFTGPRLDAERVPAPVLRAMRSTFPIWLTLAYFIWSKYLPGMARIVAGEGNFLDFAIPLGVSYFSFKLIHYAIEMRRGNFPDHGIADFASWLFLAPIFTAGPIERFEHFVKNREITAFRSAFLAEGGLRIAQGLVKKFVLGILVFEMQERLSGGGVVELLGHLEATSVLTVWAFLLLTLAYVYLDFSAYSDIAIGSSRLFGLRIMENFNLPFLATNLQMFWQRWHMTLAHWCRSYIYMSMIGLTRNPYWAVVATFFVMGLWHSAGPHWVAWGLWHGTGMAALIHFGRIAQKRKFTLLKRPGARIFAWAATMGFVALGGAFTMLHGREGIFQSVRLIARAFGINL